MARPKKAAAAKVANKKKETPAALAASLAAKFSKAEKKPAPVEKQPKKAAKALDQKPLNELTRNSTLLESLNLFIYKRKNQ
jgi:hypothetical protein